MAKVVKFWGPAGEYGFLDNFFEREIVINDKVYATTEHYFQACKARNEKDHEFIRLQPNPGKSKYWGNRINLRPDWEEVKGDVMLEALRAKFTQHSDLQALLLLTGDSYIIETSPYDKIWGWGPKRNGQNRLGKSLIQIREEIKGGLN